MATTATPAQEPAQAGNPQGPPKHRSVIDGKPASTAEALCALFDLKPVKTPEGHITGYSGALRYQRPKVTFRPIPGQAARPRSRTRARTSPARKRPPKAECSGDDPPGEGEPEPHSLASNRTSGDTAWRSPVSRTGLRHISTVLASYVEQLERNGGQPLKEIAAEVVQEQERYDRGEHGAKPLLDWLLEDDYLGLPVSDSDEWIRRNVLACIGFKVELPGGGDSDPPPQRWRRAYLSDYLVARRITKEVF